MDLPDWMDKSYKIDGDFIPGTARLFPAKHHTEGFFIAKFKKNNSFITNVKTKILDHWSN